MVVEATDTQRELAAQAYKLYVEKNYGESVTALQLLQQLRRNDDRVKHNCLIANYSEGYRDLSALKNMLDALVERAKREAVDGEAHTCLEGAYNSALISFALRQYQATAAILDDLIRYLEAADESLARKICFLHLETCLALRQPERGVRVLAWLEKLVSVGEKEREMKEKEKEKESGAKEGGAKEEKEKINGNDPIGQDDLQILRFQIHLYKAKLHLATKSMKLCKREIKLCLNASTQQCAGLFIKGNFEYLRQNYRKSIKLLNSCGTLQDNPVMSVLYFNNLAVIHFQMHKYNMASFYLNKAFEYHDKLRNEGKATKQGPSVIPCDLRYELAYNRGLQLLHSSQPLAALKAFSLSLGLYHDRPRVWCRMMEACVLADSLKLKEERTNYKTPVCRKTVGTGANRTLILPPSLAPFTPFSTESGKLNPEPTLQYGYWCARNALSLLDKKAPVDTSSETPGQGMTSPTLATQSSAQSESESNEANDVRLTVLINMAFISLSLANYQSALDSCKRVLENKNASSMHRHQAHVYSGEAHILLGQIDEAMTLLNPESTNKNLPDECHLSHQLNPITCLYLNMATALCMKNDFNTAQSCIAKAIKDYPITMPHPPQAVLLAAYIELYR
eukprot:Ihof_evm15s16 gene=Ihof_evmTU15s16